ncbi:hypothetical protein BBK36DRAFT_1145311 [Trichoderma citrinoviride]|uniref:Glycine-rich cell wall structural protein 1 n=1 Tax=Trichoderma citrinoviride TaxID=58853 RepID=A0A2T4AXN9_9HYPO|nr:hypothetical protein BBK36DRAFT_1145311 [Trichoderma citrinoviride]PTB61842.1 hypothetical protein BBK36DRAFT_1145311 [Trichoderma citrinoviride]
MASTMETINQLASSAAKAVWGDSNPETHEEPISGATGDVSKGEPYDAGNLDPEAQHKVESSLNAKTNTTDKDDTPSDLAEGEYYALSSSAKYKPLPETPDTQERPNDMTTTTATKPQNTTLPQDTSKPRDTATDTSLDKPAGKSTAEPADAPVNPEEGKPLDQLSGKGPRPVEEVAREHGGNAAAAASDDSVSSPQDKDSKPQPSVEAKQEHQNAHEGDKAAEETEYVKTTGLAADGGNFDASKPGAGLEADRLMEQKGLKSAEDDSKGTSGGRKSSDSGHHHHKDKPSVKERIKNKLHRH